MSPATLLSHKYIIHDNALDAFIQVYDWKFADGVYHVLCSWWNLGQCGKPFPMAYHEAVRIKEADLIHWKPYPIIEDEQHEKHQESDITL